MQGKRYWMATSLWRDGEAASRNIFVNPGKSIRKIETQLPPTTLSRVTKKRLRLALYKLRRVQALKGYDKQNHKEFCVEKYVDFEYEFKEHQRCCTFYTTGNNEHNFRIWDKEKA